MKPFGRVLVWASVLLSGTGLLAQPAPPDQVPPSYSAPTALGISVLGNPGLNLISINDYVKGTSATHNTLQLSASLGMTWSLQIRATDDLRYQIYSIPISAIGVQAINLGNRPEILLSTTDQLLASGFATTLLNQVTTIRYRALGGSAFLKPAGTYTTTLIFTYTAL